MDHSGLPIDAILPEVRKTLATTSAAVLVAPPGAGKTTIVPLALRDEVWLAGQRIVVLEPRRLAARAAAHRMAQLCNENLGRTIGLRARLDTQTGPAARVEVMTEGVFTRIALSDPTLEGIGAVIFDEFHERSLDTDFGLALARDIQSGLRPELRLLVMSATLDGARVATMLDDCPVLRSDGRSFPVATRYLGRLDHRRIEDGMVSAIRIAMTEEDGAILAFLPGQAEIRRTHDRLLEMMPAGRITIAPLYGGLDARAQREALEPASTGVRKIVLATAIAETSLTIDGVRVVIDSGLVRVPRYDASARVTRLETQRVSRASADQRRGRAGRTAPGVCYRLWDEPETRSLRPFETPEILSVSLAGLVLDCAAWGVTDPRQLEWLDPPPAAAIDAARQELLALGAIDARGGITPHGADLRSIAMPPHLASMVVTAARSGEEEHAAAIAAILVERGLGGDSIDLDDRLNRFAADTSPRARSMRALMKHWVSRARRVRASGHGAAVARSTAALLAIAYPDRIARARGTPGDYHLANGRGGRMDSLAALADAPFIVVAELVGAAAAGRITLAARLAEEDMRAIAGDRVVETFDVRFDPVTKAVRARRQTHLDRLLVARQPAAVPDTPEVVAELCRGIAQLGIAELPWTKRQKQLLQRVAFLRSEDLETVPDVSDGTLASIVSTWLGPFLTGKSAIADIVPADLDSALDVLLPWDVRQRLDRDAPADFRAPTGHNHPIAYDRDAGPSVSLRVQEVFGLTTHPVISPKRIPLTLVLLSPAGRPLQVTQELPRFWAGSWKDVAAEMRGRYPKHLWPDDPAAAQPTTRAKPRRR